MPSLLGFLTHTCNAHTVNQTGRGPCQQQDRRAGGIGHIRPCSLTLDHKKSKDVSVLLPFTEWMFLVGHRVIPKTTVHTVASTYGHKELYITVE